VFTQKRGRAFLSRGRPFVAGWVGLDGILFFDERSERDSDFDVEKVKKFAVIFTFQKSIVCVPGNVYFRIRTRGPASRRRRRRRAPPRARAPPANRFVRACVHACHTYDGFLFILPTTVHKAPPTHDGLHHSTHI
jgi:hypothetical protein